MTAPQRPAAAPPAFSHASSTERQSRRQVLLLAAAQALFQTVAVIVVAVGGLAGARISPDAAWATAPLGAMFLGTALGTVPASMWMARVGRRPGFLLGAALGVAGGAVAALGLGLHSFALLCLGTGLLGVYQAFAQFYRFAAGEVASDALRTRAISWVLAGGVVAAFAGPWLARWGHHLTPTAYAGSFVLASAVSVLAWLLLTRLRMPAPTSHTPVAGPPARPWAAMVGQPAYLVALFGAATGAGVMVLAMTATPLAMHQHHHSLDHTSLVIQLHVLGMFVPSFFTGSLIARFGVLPVMGAGVLLLAGHVAATLSGTWVPSFALALLLLGVGWNFLYIGGTTLLTTAYTPAERGRAQAFNDLFVFGVGLIASSVSGALLKALGWQLMNLWLLPWLALAALVLLAFAWRQRQERRAAPAPG
jgi:MFS family permease